MFLKFGAKISFFSIGKKKDWKKDLKIQGFKNEGNSALKEQPDPAKDK